MDERAGEAPRPRRWLVWAAAALLTAGMVTAGVTSRDVPAEVDIVTAAGRAPGVVDVGPTVTLPPVALQPPAAAPTTVVRPSTTLPKAAVAVLKAIASTVPPTTQAAPSTTVPETTTTSTTVPPAPTPTSTTAPTVPPRATFTLANQHPQMVLLAINGRVVELAPGGVLTTDLALAPSGSTPVRVQTKADLTCDLDGPSRAFQPGGQYRITIVAGPTACARFAAPALEISPPA